MCYEKVHCGYTPPSRDGLSYANKTRNADTAEELFLKGLGVFSGVSPPSGCPSRTKHGNEVDKQDVYGLLFFPRERRKRFTLE